jgi:thioredoxin reductase
MRTKVVAKRAAETIGVMSGNGKRKKKSGELDYLIIGGGPAGLQLAYFLSKAGRHYLILERTNTPGSFFERFPRSRSLISFNKKSSLYSDPELLLRWDWNSLLTDNYEFMFPEFSDRLYPRAEELLRYFRSFSEKYELAIQYNTGVRSVMKEQSGRFVIKDDNGKRYVTRCLVIATGTSQPYVPPIPGIELAEGYESVSMRRRDFKDQKVLIIGKGNSAFEIAEGILDWSKLIHLASPTPIRMAWKTRHAGDLRAHYTRLMDAYQLKMLHGVLDCRVESIEKRKDGKFVATVAYTHAEGERERIVYDRIVRATGFKFDDSIFADGTHPLLVMDGRFPEMSSGWESTNVPDMFFAGTLMQMRDFRKAASPFIDGFRYNVRTLYHLLEQRYYNRPLPGEDITPDAPSVTRAILGRICRNSALWAQFGYLCDTILIDERARVGRYLFELPVDYVHDCEIGRSAHYYTVTFEWGRWDGDVFNIARHPAHERADAGAFLHPIVRRFCRGRMVSQHHLLEDLLGMYCGVGETGTIETRGNRDMNSYHAEEHEVPLRRFFEAQLGASLGGNNLTKQQAT